MSWEYDTFERSILPNCAEINVDTFTEFVHYHYFFLLQWLRAAIVQLKVVALKCETVGWMLHCLMCLPYSLIIKQIWHSSSWSLFQNMRRNTTLYCNYNHVVVMICYSFFYIRMYNMHIVHIATIHYVLRSTHAYIRVGTVQTQSFSV